MAPSPLDIKLEIVFNDKQLKYYPGDQIEGKIFLTANQNYSLRNFRLAWTGRIQVQPIQANKDTRTYFDECWKLGSELTKSPTKVNKGTSNVPFYITNLVLVHQDCQEPKVELQKNKTLGLTFKVSVPNDRPLPSCTETGTTPNKIIYLLEAFIDDRQIRNSNEKPVFFTQKIVPVFERIYTRTPEMTTPQRAEQVFMVSLFAEAKEFTSAMRVTLPCRGSQPGIAIPVSISIWNNMEFTRRQGISISLFRVNHVLANGRAYTSQGEKVHRVVTDLNITTDNSTPNNQKVQTVRVGLPIPRGTMPTITLEQSQLLSVSYFIRVQVFAQEGVYTTSEGTKSQFMTVDLPFIVGTLAAPSTTGNSSPSLPTYASSLSPTLTNKSLSPTMSPLSSPRSSYAPVPSMFTQQQNSPPQTPQLQQLQQQQQRQSFDVGSTNETATEISDTASITNSTNVSDSSNSNINNRKSKIMGNMFRKSSTGSTLSSTSSEEKKKKKSVFSTLRLYGSKKSSNQDDSENVEPQQENQEQQVSPAVVMTPKQLQQQQQKEEQQQQQQHHHQQQQQQQGGVFDIFAGDDVDDDDDIPKNYSKIEQEIISSISTPPIASPPLQSAEANKGRFQMFPDDDDDDSDQEDKNQVVQDTVQEQKSVAMETNNSRLVDQTINSTAAKMENLTFHGRSNQQQAPAPQQSNVFKMFDDDDSDDDEEEVLNELSVSQERVAVLIDERVKPHHQGDEEKHRNDKPNTYNYYYKPNTMTDSSEDEPDANDLLAEIARREKLV